MVKVRLAEDASGVVNPFISESNKVERPSNTKRTETWAPLIKLIGGHLSRTFSSFPFDHFTVSLEQFVEGHFLYLHNMIHVLAPMGIQSSAGGVSRVTRMKMIQSSSPRATPNKMPRAG
jgi:hypothetical protein